MHICPQEVAMFFMAIPIVRWIFGCCRKCCVKPHKHKGWFWTHGKG